MAGTVVATPGSEANADSKMANKQGRHRLAEVRRSARQGLSTRRGLAVMNSRNPTGPRTRCP